MNERVCARCSHANPVNASYCTNCGGQRFVPEPQEPHGPPPPGQPLLTEGYALQIGIGRIIIMSIVTSGVYVLFWLYQTWRQLQVETKEVHFPAWHAATLFVPVYGLFRLHRHLSVIQELAQKRGLESVMPPVLGVTLVALNLLLVVVSGNQADLTIVLVLGLIRLALVTTLMVQAQKTLNSYWDSIHGTRAIRIPLGRTEIGFVLIVLAAQFILISILGSSTT